MIQLFNPKFRGAKQSDVLKSVDFNKEWRPYGYTKMLFNRSESTVYLFRDASDYFYKVATINNKEQTQS